ncbi:MAG: hypothetical protein EOO38_05960 [Cytophagaceae bacterium]|nr:MAG: hypothetical protein EOO38_05960 [Cytophagaceae bacterium]
MHGSFGFLLHYDGTIPDAAAGNDVADANLDDIAAVQFAVDRDVKERPVLEAPVLVKPEPNVSNLLCIVRERFSTCTRPCSRGGVHG